MCFAYFLQFVDKMVLSQTTLFGLREDLVSMPGCMQQLPLTTHIASGRRPVRMELGHILFRLPRLELAELVSACPASNWQVSGDHSVRTRAVRG